MAADQLTLGRWYMDGNSRHRWLVRELPGVVLVRSRQSPWCVNLYPWFGDETPYSMCLLWGFRFDAQPAAQFLARHSLDQEPEFPTRAGALLALQRAWLAEQSVEQPSSVAELVALRLEDKSAG